MIARLWRGHVEAGDADEYLELMRSVALPDHHSASGNLAAYVLLRRGPTVAEFTMLTLWESEAAIAQFAGDPPRRAKYYPFDRGFLLALPPDAEHLEAFRVRPTQASRRAGQTTR
jgi:heme-degrading monooxygenase HmoA